MSTMNAEETKRWKAYGQRAESGYDQRKTV